MPPFLCLKYSTALAGVNKFEKKGPERSPPC
jgi:hypothetical protein